MYKNRRILLLLGLIFLIASSAYAKDNIFDIGVYKGIGMYNHKIDEHSTIGPAGTDSEGLRIIYKSFGIDLQKQIINITPIFGDDINISATQFMLIFEPTAKPDKPDGSGFGGHLTYGLGYGSYNKLESGNFKLVGKLGNYVVITVGIGINYFFNKNFSVNAEGNYGLFHSGDLLKSGGGNFSYGLQLWF